MKHVEEVILVKRGGQVEVVAAPGLDWPCLMQICQALANFNELIFDQMDAPVLSCVIPGGHRFECLVGGSVASDVSLTIRCKHLVDIQLENLGLTPAAISYIDYQLKAQANMIIAGSPFTGKTTFLNNLLKRLPDSRRVIAVEDTPELDLDRFWNGLSLLAARNKNAQSNQLTYSQLYDHKMRSSPDNIIFGEISVDNAKSALNALNTGSKGFLCTVHAESAEMVPQRFADNISAANQHMGDVREFMSRVVDVIVHIGFDANGKRQVREIWEMRNNRYMMRGGEFFESNVHYLI